MLWSCKSDLLPPPLVIIHVRVISVFDLSSTRNQWSFWLLLHKRRLSALTEYAVLLTADGQWQRIHIPGSNVFCCHDTETYHKRAAGNNSTHSSLHSTNKRPSNKRRILSGSVTLIVSGSVTLTHYSKHNATLFITYNIRPLFHDSIQIKEAICQRFLSCFSGRNRRIEWLSLVKATTRTSVKSLGNRSEIALNSWTPYRC